MFRTLFLLLLVVKSLTLPAQSGPAIIALSSEWLSAPIGLDEAHPRLAWKWNDATAGSRQTAYQIWVSTDSIFSSSGLVWQTGKKLSPQQQVVYAGKPLIAFQRYYWKLVAYDQQLHPLPAARSSFEMGMMNSGNWKGSWISDLSDVNIKPAGMFRKSFQVGKTVRSARAYIAVGGLYELSINGKRIGQHRLDPMYTRFDRRTLYVTYDISNELKAGENVSGVLLGNGWYNHQSTAVWDFHHAPWRARPAFCMDIRIEYTDGSIETVATGKDWKASLSEIDFNSIYTAEHVDARKLQPGWNQSGFADSSWKRVILRSAPSENIVSQAMVPIEWVETIPTSTFKKINDTVFLYDLGRNISGVSSLKVKGPAGTVLRLKHAERLDSSGRADQSNIDVHYRPTDQLDPFQTDIFILSGKGTDSFTPRFNYKGFQYVEIRSSQPIALEKDNLKAYFMHSNVKPVGGISTSDSLLQKIWQATNSSYLSNLFGYPTDCPQREKNGWTGDAHIAIETGLYNFDAITVYEKWLADHRDEQQPNGVLPSIIPTGGWGYEWGNGPDWTSTIAIIPWSVYLFYGDQKLLADSYSAMKRYVDRITAISPTGLTSWGLGDWIPVKSVSPVELTSTAYYYKDALIVSKAAAVLGKKQDALSYAALAAKIKEAYNKKYFNSTTASYGSGFQTELSVSLVHGLVPENYRSAVAANLAKAVTTNGGKLDVGLLGTKAILNALSENGYADIAYQLAAADQYPSWGYWIKNGATTLYENWPINAKSDISLNHIMFGEIGAWMFKGLAGIFPDEKDPGFRKIILKPHFVKGLDQFEAWHEGPQGKIISSWKMAGDKLEYQVTVPPNSTAELHFEQVVNGKKIHLLKAGLHTFSVDTASL